MLHDVKAKIEKNQPVSPSVNYLELSLPKIPSKLKPGHFVHVRLMHTNDPLLRRPLSVNRVITKKTKGKTKKHIGIVYKIVGKGTNLLKEMAIGEVLDVLGPLGNGFDLSPAVKDKRPVLLISGGMGIAPMLFIADKIKTASKAIAFIGMDTKKELICAQDLKKLGCQVKISTDDGTSGFKGYVSDLLKKYLSKSLNPKSKNLYPEQSRGAKPYIYACGPKPMLKALQQAANEFEIPGQVSLDEMIGCGIGACLGCVIKTRDLTDPKQSVYKRICKDGPVFDINQIIWEE